MELKKIYVEQTKMFDEEIGEVEESEALFNNSTNNSEILNAPRNKSKNLSFFSSTNFNPENNKENDAYSDAFIKEDSPQTYSDIGNINQSDRKVDKKTTLNFEAINKEEPELITTIGNISFQNLDRKNKQIKSTILKNKEKNYPSESSEEFQPFCIENLLLKRQLFLRNCKMSFPLDMEMREKKPQFFDFDFEQQKSYNFYCPKDNYINSLRKFMKYSRRRAMKHISSMKNMHMTLKNQKN